MHGLRVYHDQHATSSFRLVFSLEIGNYMEQYIKLQLAFYLLCNDMEQVSNQTEEPRETNMGFKMFFKLAFRDGKPKTIN